MKMFPIENHTIKVGGANSAAGKQATNWNDEIIRSASLSNDPESGAAFAHSR
jgi:hypothetical protein